MTLLVDNQLPSALARFLSANGVECLHVRDVGLDQADDAAIWSYAKEHRYTIVTKDEDFQAMANRQRSIPPQVVWVRLGNCRKVDLLASFAKILPALLEELASGSAVVEIR
jgi:predicted nuclease of predicted toxin-antitoxin system